MRYLRFMTLLRCVGVAAVVLAGCASQQGQLALADSDASATSVDADAHTGSSGTEPAVSAASTIASTTTSVDAAEHDSSPTTETGGLSAPPASSTVAPSALSCERIENFGDESTSRWRVVNDGVMGGLSMGALEEDGGVVRFSGMINTNGGGFSLMRTSILRDGQRLDEALNNAEYLRFRIRSANGRGYELIAEDASSPSQVMHFAPIDVDGSGTWQELLVPLADLEARAFGTSRIDAEPFQIDQVTSIGVILADGIDGPFSAEIDRIDACRT